MNEIINYESCEVCGRPIIKKILRANGLKVCNKHYRQYKTYGKFLDSNPRTIYDRNEFHIMDDVTYIDLYNKHCELVGHAIIDTEDLDKVKDIKWKLSGSGYACNTPKGNKKNLHMHRVILGVDEPVDHINHNTLDNRKSNLRVITKSQNQMNSNYKGVSLEKDGRFYAHIKLDQRMLNLGKYTVEAEAYYARWYAEKIMFKEYRYPKEMPNISDKRAREIERDVDIRIQRFSERISRKF